MSLNFDFYEIFSLCYENYSYFCTAKQKVIAAKIVKRYLTSEKLTNKNKKGMRTMHKTSKVNKARAIEIAANHNCVSKEIAQNYTDSELREVLRALGLKAGF